MSEELKPCPLCGSTDIACFAEECGDDYDGVPTFRAVVGCRGCHEEGCDPSYDDKPCFGIEAYYRADHPLLRNYEDPSDCKRVLERHMAERWNRRAERTVRPTLYDDFCGCVNVCCPTCGRTLSGPWSDVRDAVRSSKRRDVMGNYCPGCGARIEVCE